MRLEEQSEKTESCWENLWNEIRKCALSKTITGTG